MREVDKVAITLGEHVLAPRITKEGERMKLAKRDCADSVEILNFSLV